MNLPADKAGIRKESSETQQRKILCVSQRNNYYLNINNFIISLAATSAFNFIKSRGVSSPIS